MALQSSGAISMANVNQEIGRATPYNQQIALNDTVVRTLFAKASGVISMSDGYGKTYVPYGNSVSFTASGTWTVPAGITSIRVKCWGGGGAINDYRSYGGGGGFINGYLAVTPGNTITISSIGAGGLHYNIAELCSLGSPLGDYYDVAGGGGGTAVYYTTSAYMIAGGGGGGTYASPAVGGAGGGVNGVDGTPFGAFPNNYGRGAVGSTGGAGGSGFGPAGTAGQSHTANSFGFVASGGAMVGVPTCPYDEATAYNGCYGGGGWAGGGGTSLGAGAGGGSSGSTGFTTVTNTAGSGPNPGGTGDSDYSGTIARGGSNATVFPGQAGKVVIRY